MARKRTPSSMTKEAFRDMRLRLGLSMEVLSEVMGLSRRTIVHWEHGDTPIPKYGAYAMRYLEERHFQDLKKRREQEAKNGVQRLWHEMLEEKVT